MIDGCLSTPAAITFAEGDDAALAATPLYRSASAMRQLDARRSCLCRRGTTRRARFPAGGTVAAADGALVLPNIDALRGGVVVDTVAVTASLPYGERDRFLVGAGAGAVRWFAFMLPSVLFLEVPPNAWHSLLRTASRLAWRSRRSLPVSEHRRDPRDNGLEEEEVADVDDTVRASAGGAAVATEVAVCG